MPVISQFYGIVIRMLFKRNFGPHFHAFYGDKEVMVGVSPVRIIRGDASGRVNGMLLEWAARHQRELVEDWNLCRHYMEPKQIDPLQ